jgi:molybdenum cofactor cytidylyltransferase
MTSFRTAILIPAAGNSSRLGLPKQLLQLHEESLLRRIAETALALQPVEVVVVLGFESDRMKHELDDLPVQIHLNAGWKEGIASSIRTGIESLPQSVDAVLIALSDQPFIPSSHFGRLIAACSIEHPIAATAYGQSAGVPACFSRPMFPELLALTGDSGAKRILERHRHEVAAFPCTEASIDIDTLADYRKHLDSHDGS